MSIYEENQTSSSEQENSWLRRNWNQAKGKQKFCTAYKFSPCSQSVMVKQLKRPPDTLMWRELDGSGDLQDIKAHLGLLHSLISVSVSLGHSVQAGSAPCCCGWAAAWARVSTGKVWEETWFWTSFGRGRGSPAREAAPGWQHEGSSSWEVKSHWWGVCTITQSKAGTTGQWQQPMCSLCTSSWPEMGSTDRKNNSFLL